MSGRGGRIGRGKPRAKRAAGSNGAKSDNNDDTDNNNSSSSSNGSSDSSVGDIISSLGVALPDAPECLLCCNTIVHYVIVSCSHTMMICATCALRLRLFMVKEKKEEKKTPAAGTGGAATTSGDTAAPVAAAAAVTPSGAAASTEKEKEKPKWECPFCKDNWTKVIISSAATKQLHDFTDDQLHFDSEIEVYFDAIRIRELYRKLRSIYCTLCQTNNKPDKLYRTLHHLGEHLQREHGRFLCSACVTSRQVFVHERESYTKSGLTEHFKGRAGGDGVAASEPHPFCEFCNVPYYSNDELYAHLINKHKYCQICSMHGAQKYFKGDVELVRHYRSNHFVCMECHTLKPGDSPVVFGDMVDLKAHNLAVHMDTATMSRSELKKAAALDLGFFNPVADLPRGPRSHGGGRRGNHHHNNDNGQDFNVGGETDAEADIRRFMAERNGDTSGSNGTSIEERARIANRNVRNKRHGNNNNSSADEYQTNNQRPEVDDDVAFPALSDNGPAVPTPIAIPRRGVAGAGVSMDEFPTLGGAPGSGARVTLTPGSAPPSLLPTAGDFPALKTTTRKPKRPQSAAAKKSSPTTSAPSKKPAVPTSAWAHVETAPDQRKLSHVPLPLPDVPPVAEQANRNKLLIAMVKEMLGDDTTKFDRFRTISMAFRQDSITAATYYDEFYQLCDPKNTQEARMEKLFIELVCLLPDEDKRRALHGEYARRKVMARLGGVSPGASSPSPSPPSSASPTTTAPSSTTVDEQPSRNAQRAAENKKKLQATGTSSKAKKGPQGINEFEGKEAVALKRDDGGLFPASSSSSSTSSGKALTLEEIAREAKEKRKKEAIQAGMVAAAEAKAAAEAAKIAAIAAAETAAAEAKAAADSEAKATKPSSPNDSSIVSPKPKAPSKSGSGAVPPGITIPSSSTTSTSRASPSPSPPLGDSTTWVAVKPMRPLSSGLPSPADLDTILLAIGQLSIGLVAKHRFEFMGMLLLQTTFALTERHGDLGRGAGSQFYPSATTRSSIALEVRRLGASSLLDFTPLAKLGMAAQSVALLGKVAAMHQKTGADAALQSWMTESLATISSNDLFILYEYVHTLLQAMSSSSHADIGRMITDEAKRFAAHGPEPPLVLGTSNSSISKAKKAAARGTITANSGAGESKRSPNDNSNSGNGGNTKGDWPSLPASKRSGKATPTPAQAAAQLAADEELARSLDESGNGNNGGGKKKGKGKQLLFRFGGM